MKHLKKLANKFLLLLIAPLFILSCEDDEQNIVPTITVLSDQFDDLLNFTGKAEETISFNVEVNAPNGLSEIKIILFIDNSQEAILYEKTIVANSSETMYTSPEVDFQLENSHIDKDVRILIKIVDVKFNEVSKTLNITANGKYSQGVFVLNEGNFGSANASVSHFDLVTTTAESNIFVSTTNITLGDVAQSLHIADDKAYVVVNNSNKVEVVNANTFEHSFTIDAALPRYFTTFNGKGYLTEWVSFSESGRVSVINLTTGASETTVSTGFGAENIMEANGLLYVSNNFQTNISVIDPATNTVSTTIDVGSAPGGFVLDTNGALWVICGGGFDANYAPLNNGAFYQLNTSNQTVSKTISLGANVPVKIAINNTKDAIYYFSGNEVFKLSINATARPSSAFITESGAVSFYGIGVNPENDNIYLADSKGFQANGEVFRYTADGTIIDRFNVGIGPNGFAFK